MFRRKNFIYNDSTDLQILIIVIDLLLIQLWLPFKIVTRHMIGILNSFQMLDKPWVRKMSFHSDSEFYEKKGNS